MKVNDILKEAKEILYFRTADYNRALALTGFLKELEKRYKGNFKVIGGSVKRLQCRHIETGSYWKDADKKTEQASFTTYATFIVTGTKYYIEIKDNPFFESYICIWSNYDRTRYKIERILAYELLQDGRNTLETMFKYNGKENIKKLTTELLYSFKEIKENNYTTCTQLNNKERFYF